MIKMKDLLTEADSSIATNAKAAEKVANALHTLEKTVRKMRQASGFNERVLENAQRHIVGAMDALMDFKHSAEHQ